MSGGGISKEASRRVEWRRTASAEHPYEAEIDGQRWTVRVNDFPAEPLYTLLIDSVPAGDLDEWPAAWVRSEPSEGSPR